MFGKDYKHTKVRKDSKFIYIEKCIDKKRIRFSTSLDVNVENMDYVESNYKILIQKYLCEFKKQVYSDSKYSIANYGKIVLELEKAHLKDSTFTRYKNVFENFKILSFIESFILKIIIYRI